MAITVAHCGSQLQADSNREGEYGRSVRARWPCLVRALICQCQWLRLCREALGRPGYPPVPRHPTAANGPLTDR